MSTINNRVSDRKSNLYPFHLKMHDSAGIEYDKTYLEGTGAIVLD